MEKVIKDGVIAQSKWIIKDREIIIQQYGYDDYAYYDELNDCSVRGTYKEIMEELNNIQ